MWEAIKSPSDSLVALLIVLAALASLGLVWLAENLKEQR